jgi:hypothetical protein
MSTTLAIAASPVRPRIDIIRPLAWTIAAPALAVWPFLSAFPLFELLGGEVTLAIAVTRLVLLGSGFWAAAALYAAYRFSLAGPVETDAPSKPRDTALWLGLYAAGWITLYLVVVLVV